jgi:putative transposase
MQKIEPIEYGYYYHIYNKGIDGMDLFRSDDNYSCFMELYFKYTEQVVDTYVWCLMKNHFHFLVRIKDEDEMGVYVFENNSSRSGGLWKVVSKEDLPEFAEPGRVEKKRTIPSRQLAHCFNAYAKLYNNSYNRTGSLFEKPFKRKLVESEDYLRRLVFYIHHNPVHHNVTDTIIEYPWSSYLDIIKPSETKLKRKEVIDWFDDVGNFISYHRHEYELASMKEVLIDF